MQLVRRSAARRAAVIGLVTLAALALAQPASALVCAREWDGDAFAGVRQAVTEPTRWDGLLVATVTAVEHTDDYWRTRVLVLEPEIVFSGSLRETVRAEIGDHGPDMSFDAGSTYFLALVEAATRRAPAGSSIRAVRTWGSPAANRLPSSVRSAIPRPSYRSR